MLSSIYVYSTIGHDCETISIEFDRYKMPKQAVPVLLEQKVFHKMADRCLLSVANDVISGQKVKGVKVVLQTKFCILSQLVCELST